MDNEVWLGRHYSETVDRTGFALACASCPINTRCLILKQYRAVVLVGDISLEVGAQELLRQSSVNLRQGACRAMPALMAFAEAAGGGPWNEVVHEHYLVRWWATGSISGEGQFQCRTCPDPHEASSEKFAATTVFDDGRGTLELAIMQVLAAALVQEESNNEVIGACWGARQFLADVLDERVHVFEEVISCNSLAIKIMCLEHPIPCFVALTTNTTTKGKMAIKTLLRALAPSCGALRDYAGLVGEKQRSRSSKSRLGFEKIQLPPLGGK